VLDRRSAHSTREKYPDRFIAAAACLPVDDVDVALGEADRAIRDLGLRRRDFTDINGEPVDAPEFWPLYENAGLRPPDPVVRRDGRPLSRRCAAGRSMGIHQ
jgi:hypothetical protein